MSKINKIRYYRIQKNIGLNKFAKSIDLSPAYLSQLEEGIKKNPSKKVMERIAKALDKTVQEIFYPEEEEVEKSYERLTNF